MSTFVQESGKGTQLSASAAVRSGAGALIGVFCSSSTSGTLKLWDSTAASGTVLVNTVSLAAGTFYPMPFNFQTGLYATIGGTAEITIGWNPVA